MINVMLVFPFGDRRTGLAIKEASPACVTLVSELTDGYCGYVAIRDAYSRGGYSAVPVYSCKLDEGAGEAIVEGTKNLLAAAFPNGAATTRQQRAAK